MVDIFVVVKDDLRGKLSAVMTYREISDRGKKKKKREKNWGKKTTRAESFSGKIAGQSLSNV